MQTPKKIIVRAPNWIGDQILAFPFFYFLRKTFPKSHIAVLTVPWVTSIQFRNQVDQVLSVQKSEGDSFLSQWDAMEKTAKIIREAGPWDLGICLPNSFSSAWLFFRAGVKRRRGYRADGRSFLLNETLDWKKGVKLHRSEAYCRLIFEKKDLDPLMFWGAPAENELDPPIEGVMEKAREKLDLQGEWGGTVLTSPSSKYWILAPGSTAESRRWPILAFKQVARRMQDQFGWKGLVVGGPREAELAKELVSDPSLNLEDWTGKGDVSAYMKVFEGAQLTLTNDSGLAHMASMCGGRVQIVWGAGNPHRTRPIGPGRTQVIFNPVNCWPCERNLCLKADETHLQCIRGVDTEAVWKEILSGIGNT